MNVEGAYRRRELIRIEGSVKGSNNEEGRGGGRLSTHVLFKRSRIALVIGVGYVKRKGAFCYINLVV